ncbi:MAG: ABC transporter substrate-binding protein [Deltaproteobacteria bacterium]|nr:ABC transporter substrate-binding protein [Deltaproteobacteria bacterium]
MLKENKVIKPNKTGVWIAGLVRFLAVVAAGMMVLNACTSSEDKTQQAQKRNTVTIGWIGPLTGPISLIGVDNLKAVRMAIEKYNTDRKSVEPEIKLIIEDDQMVAKNSVNAYQKLVSEQRPDVVMLSSYSGMFLIADDALREGMILVNPIDNDSNLAKLNKNVFVIAKQTEGLAAVVANALIDQGKKKVFIVFFNGDDFMPTLGNKVKEIFEKAGGKAIVRDYPAGTSDFRSLLAAGKDVKAEGYIFFGYVEIGFAMKQAREMGITQPFYSVNVITNPELQANSQGAIEGTQFAHFTHLDGNTRAAELFLKRFQQKYHKSPAVSWTALQAFDATRIIIAAVVKASGQKGAFVDNIRRNMLGTDDFEGVSGDLSIRPDGTSRGIYPSLYTLVGGKAVKNR